MALPDIAAQIDGHDLRQDGYQSMGFTLGPIDREVVNGVPSDSGQIGYYTYKDELVDGLPPVQIGGMHVTDPKMGTFEMAGSSYQLLGSDGFGSSADSYGGIVFARASSVYPPNVVYYASRAGHITRSRLARAPGCCEFNRMDAAAMLGWALSAPPLPVWLPMRFLYYTAGY